MQRSLQETKGGLGEITFHMELDAEVEEFAKAFPRDPIAGVVTGYEWKGDKLVAFAREDPAYRPPTVLNPNKTESNLVEPVPSRDRLMDWSINDLVARAAELSVIHKPGEKKAELVARILPAWQKQYDEQTKPKAPPHSPTDPK